MAWPRAAEWPASGIASTRGEETFASTRAAIAPFWNV